MLEHGDQQHEVGGGVRDAGQRLLDRRLDEAQPAARRLASSETRRSTPTPEAIRGAQRAQQGRVVAAAEVEDARRRRQAGAAQHRAHRQRDAEAVDRAEAALAVGLGAPGRRARAHRRAPRGAGPPSAAGA